MVVGGCAAITYGELRFTADVDIVMDMSLNHVDAFVAGFSIPDHDVSREAIRDSLQRRFLFNVIQPSTGAKADFVPLPADLPTRAAFTRRQSIVYDAAANRVADFATPQDTLIAKLCAYRDTGSGTCAGMNSASNLSSVSA